MPSPRPCKMIRYFHSTVRNPGSNPPGQFWRDKWTTLRPYTLNQVVYPPEDVATALGLSVPRK
jgi:hypothetical protein